VYLACCSSLASSETGGVSFGFFPLFLASEIVLLTASAIKSLNLKTGEILITQSQGEDVQTEEKAEIK
jgi:hypothetical protein